MNVEDSVTSHVILEQSAVKAARNLRLLQGMNLFGDPASEIRGAWEKRQELERLNQLAVLLQ